jgi:hypothetical protein
MSIPGCSTEKRILRLEDAKLIRSGLSTEGDKSSEPTPLYGSAYAFDVIHLSPVTYTYTQTAITDRNAGYDCLNSWRAKCILSPCELFGRTFCALFGIGAISCPTDGRAFRRRVDRFFMYPLQSVDLENSPHLRSKHGSEVEGFRR